MALFPTVIHLQLYKIYTTGRGRERENGDLLNFVLWYTQEGYWGRPWPSLCGTQAANMRLTFDSKWGYCSPFIIKKELKHQIFGWQTGVLFFTWLSGWWGIWTDVWTDLSKDGFTLQLGNNPHINLFWIPAISTGIRMILMIQAI